jgi:hypothetical protein
LKKEPTTDEPQIEEKYEVTISSLDQSDSKLLSFEPLITMSATGEGYFA